MTEAIESMFQTLVAERGGIDALSAVDHAVLRALATALTGDSLNPTTIAQLTSLAPPVLKPAAGVIDLTKLDDDEVDYIERVRTKAGTVAAPEESAEVNRLLDLNRGLHEIIGERDRELDACQQREAMWQRMHESALRSYDEVRKRLEVAESAAWRAQHPDPQPQPAPAAPGQAEPKPSNVVPLARGNGPAALPR